MRKALLTLLVAVFAAALAVAGGLEADVEVRPGERAVGLSLRGGGAMLLKGLRLEGIQLPAPGPV